jgi:hypothetical protein
MAGTLQGAAATTRGVWLLAGGRSPAMVVAIINNS